MAQQLKVDVCVIGAGSGGLSVAAGAAQMGASTVLVEKGKMGGDCLNYGCVPSKSLLAAGHAAHSAESAARLGVNCPGVEIDFSAVHDHVHGVIASIAPHDSVERFEGLGVKVIQAEARFIGPGEVEAGEYLIAARRFVIATGSSPLVPPIPGIGDVPYRTNETIFDMTRAPAHLIVIGGGPIGLELAQAHRRLGSKVTVVEMDRILNKDDPELVDIVRAGVRAEGVDIREGVKVIGAGKHEAGKHEEGVAVTIDDNGAEKRIVGSDLLLAAGRKANVEGLGLEAAGIDYSPRGIKVDARLRTTNRRVYAAGDVVGRLQFTHVAAHHADVVIRNVLFRQPAKVNERACPWVTYTSPELANVGRGEHELSDRDGEIRILRWPFTDNDRARTERDTDGLIKVVTGRRGRVLGAAIVGAHAGELILPWVLAVAGKLKLKEMAQVIAPYPTRSEVSKRAAGSFYTGALFSPWVKTLVRFLARFG
ncbi:MAG: FAD-dependent oxidoreductase [Proteobacteria bacterium]|nr:FAD-dependent oxidoreductase [Pseudomonadota bacterium]